MFLMAMCMWSWIYFSKHLLALYQLLHVRVHSFKHLSKYFPFVVEEFEVAQDFLQFRVPLSWRAA